MSSRVLSADLSAAAPHVQDTAQADVRPVKQTYGQILKSTALIGGSSVVTIAFGIIRTKALALILGPVGVGLMGLYNSISDVAFGVAGLGVQSSGVRQIAEAVGTGDSNRIARTALVLRRVSVVLGILGALMLIGFSGRISQFTFGGREHVLGVALLSLAVCFRLISGGQIALVQGMRRIGDLARINVIAAVSGTAIGIPVIYVFGERGIVPSLVAVAAVSILTSWWYSGKVRTDVPTMTVADVVQEVAALLKLGVAFMASGFLLIGAGYAVRIIVLRQIGIEAAGFYQAAWALGGLYVGFILQAMGADFYPRLTAVSRDNVECNRLVNEQAHISLLLAGPGVIATLTLAPLVIAIFYSAQFGAAVSILRWICLGATLQVVAWPLGFIIVAKGAQQIFLWTEMAAAAIQVALAWVLVRYMGVDGAGAAFFGLYLWHTLVIYAIVRRFTGFRWSSSNARLGAMYLPLTALVFGLFYLLPFWLATSIGGLISAATAVFSLRTLVRLVSTDSLHPGLRSLLSRLRLLQPAS